MPDRICFVYVKQIVALARRVKAISLGRDIRLTVRRWTRYGPSVERGAVHMHEWRSAEVGVPMTHLRAWRRMQLRAEKAQGVKASKSAWRRGAQRRAEGGELRCKCK